MVQIVQLSALCILDSLFCGVPLNATLLLRFRSFNLISGGGPKPNRIDESLGVKYYEAWERTRRAYLYLCCTTLYCYFWGLFELFSFESIMDCHRLSGSVSWSIAAVKRFHLLLSRDENYKSVSIGHSTWYMCLHVSWEFDVGSVRLNTWYERSWASPLTRWRPCTSSQLSRCYGPDMPRLFGIERPWDPRDLFIS